MFFLTILGTSLKSEEHLKGYNIKILKMKRNTFKTAVLVFGIALFMSNSSLGQSENRTDRKKPPTFKQLLKDMDANEDGKLSKKEVKGPLKDHFTKVDADEDGFITEEEMKKAPKPKRQEPPKRN